MDIPAHLERLHQQHPDLTRTSATYQNSDKYTYDSLPRDIPLSKLPGQKFLDVLQDLEEFDLLKTNAEATFDTDEDSEWCPHYYIGGGGFGKVGVWQKKNAKDEVVDEVAIKEMQGCYDELFWPDSRALGLRRRLLTEAAIQSQLNQSQSENFVHLRDYKYFNQNRKADNDKLYEDPSSKANVSDGTEKWRLYLELAPYGDLYDLFGKYRYWNQYLPEAFIWHVFDSLAEAAVNLRDCQWADMPTHRVPPGPPATTDKMVNYDIKPDNILLSYPDHRSSHLQQNRSTYGGTKKYDYPAIKLGDFGICRWTGPADETNPCKMPTGTSGFMPPEMVQYGIWWEPISNANYTVPFSDSLRPKARSSFCVTDNKNSEWLGYPKIGDVMRGVTKNEHFHEDEKLHVWAIGKVIYDLMHLCRSEVYWERSTRMRDEFIRYSNHQLPWFDPGPQNANTDDRTRMYSVELCDLVRDCMRPFWSERLDVGQMKVRTAGGMANWDSKYTPGCEDGELDKMDPQRDTKHPKLVYRKNDINNMPRGKQRFVLVENDDTDKFRIDEGVDTYYHLKNQIRHNPDWPELRPVWDDYTKRKVWLPGADLNASPVSETHHQNWVQHQANVVTEVDNRYELDSKTGGLRLKTLWTGGSDDDDDDNDDDENPYKAPRLEPRGHPPSDRPGPPSVSPLSPRQQSTAPQPTVQQPTAQQPIVQQPTIPPNPTRRSPTPIAPLSPDPADCITDPSDSEVEIAIRTLRGRRKISYYRPKRKNLKNFNQEYVRRRRGEKVNAKVEPWMTSGESKFRNAIRRRKEAWSQSKREYDTRKISYDRWKARQQTIATQANPITATPNTVPAVATVPALPNANQQQRPPRITTYQGFPLPPRQPGQQNWADGYFRAWAAAQARRIPDLPPNGNVTDASFFWDNTSRRFLRTENNTLMYYQPNNLPQQQGTGRWIPLLPFPQVTRPNGTPNTNAQQSPVRPALPQAAPLPAPPSQPTSGSLAALTTDSLPARVPNQTNWAAGYFQAWASDQAGAILPMPRGIDPTDVTFYWNDVQRTYVRQDRDGRSLVWRTELAVGDGRWVELRMGTNGMPQLNVPNNVDPNSNTNPQPNHGPPGPPQTGASQAIPPPPAPPTTTRPLRGLVRPEYLPPRRPSQATWSNNYYQVWVSHQMGYLPPIPPGVSATDNTFYWHLTFGWYMRQDRNNQTWAWNEEQQIWSQVHFTAQGKLRIRGGWGG